MISCPMTRTVNTFRLCQTVHNLVLEHPVGLALATETDVTHGARDGRTDGVHTWVSVTWHQFILTVTALQEHINVEAESL